MPPESVSTIRPTSMLGSIVSLGTLALFCAVGALVAPRAEIGILAGALVFLAYRLAVREWLCRAHRRGMRMTQAGNFREGLGAFQESERFWVGHPTLDRYRWALLASAGPYSFLTLARYNQAYCLSRLNRVKDASKVLERVLADSPQMGPAIELRDSLDKVLNTGEPGAERTWADHDPAESTWVFDEPKK